MNSTRAIVSSLVCYALMAFFHSATAATILVAENFGGLNSTNLAGTSADTYDSALGGSGNWAGDANIKADGEAYGNNIKTVYLNLGSYINDAKGTADGKFELVATLGPGLLNQRGTSYDWLSFSNSTAPSGGDTTTFVTGIGINVDGSSLVYSIESGMASAPSTTTTTAGIHTFTISLDLTSAYYNGVDQFGRITLSDSVAGVLGSPVTLTTNTNFNSIALLVGAGINSGSRTDAHYYSLTLTQLDAVPEPRSALLGALGILLLLRRHRRQDP